MSSQIGITNRALTFLGTDPISSIDEDSREARLVNAQWDEARQATLFDHPWNFAIKRASLAQLAETPVYGYSAKYQLPNDYLRVISTGNDPTDYVIESDTLLTDDGSISVRYISDVTKSGYFSAGFAEAFAKRLAYELAYPLTGNRALAEQMWNLYQVAINKAKSGDAQEGTPRKINNSNWLNARTRGR